MHDGLPDLDQPLAGLPAPAWRAWGRPGEWVVAPQRLVIEDGPDGQPRIGLALLRGAGRADAARATLELGLALEVDAAACGAALAARGERGRIVFAEAAGGWLHAALALPAEGDAADAAMPPMTVTRESVGPGALEGLRLSFEIPPDRAGLAARLVEAGTLPLEARLRLSVPAIAPRLPLAARFDPRALAEALAARCGAQARLDAPALQAALDALLWPAAEVEGDPQALDAAQRARVLGLRLGARLAVPVAAEAAEGPAATSGGWQLRPAQDVMAGLERLDLAAPALVRVELGLALDQAAAAQALSRIAPAARVRRIELPPLPLGRERLDVELNLPEPNAGLSGLCADLRLPAALPWRPQPVSASASLDTPDRRAELLLQTAPGEAPSGERRLRGWRARDGSAVEWAGAWRPWAGGALRFGPDDLPMPLRRVRATPALLAQARVEIHVGGWHEAAAPDTAAPVDGPAAVLDRGHPEISLPVDEDESWRLELRPLDGGAPIVIQPGARRRLDLDLATLPGFGLHEALFRCSVPAPRLIEWRADADDAAVQTLRLGAERRESRVSWLAASPFRPGLRWRRAPPLGAAADTEAPWSAPLAPADGLCIDLDEETPMKPPPASLDLEGLRLQPLDDDGRIWCYRPAQPAFELDPAGRPQFKLIEAGGVAFLQCTARLALDEPRRAALLARLRLQQPQAASIEAEPLDVQRIALERPAGDGGWQSIAESRGSGMAPWTAALAATLDAGALQAIRRALQGERASARLLVQARLPAAPRVERRSEALHETRIDTRSDGVAASLNLRSTRRASTGGGTAADAADAVPPLVFTADLADLLASPGGPGR